MQTVFEDCEIILNADKIVKVRRIPDGKIFVLGESVCINQSFPRPIKCFGFHETPYNKTIIVAGFDYDGEILYNSMSELRKHPEEFIPVINNIFKFAGREIKPEDVRVINECAQFFSNKVSVELILMDGSFLKEEFEVATERADEYVKFQKTIKALWETKNQDK